MNQSFHKDSSIKMSGPRRNICSRNKIPSGRTKYTLASREGFLTPSSQVRIPMGPLVDPPPKLMLTLTTGPHSNKTFRYAKPVIHWIKLYLRTMVYLDEMGYPDTLVYLEHLVSECQKAQTWGEPYLNTLR